MKIREYVMMSVILILSVIYFLTVSWGRSVSTLAEHNTDRLNICISSLDRCINNAPQCPKYKEKSEVLDLIINNCGHQLLQCDWLMNQYK